MTRAKHIHAGSLLLLCAIQANPGLGAPPGPQVTAPSGSVSASSDELYAQAESQYAAGDLLGALESMQRCYELTHSVNLLFNLGELHRELSHCEMAVEYYQRYLDAAPNGERAADAKGHADRLRDECPPKPGPSPTAPFESTQARAELPPPAPAAARPTLLAPPPVALPATAPAKVPWATIGWVAVGTATAATAMATYFAIETHQAKADVEAGLNASDFNWSRDHARLEERRSDFLRARGLAVGSGVLAVLALGTGAYAWTSSSSETPAKASACFVTWSAHLLRTDCQIRF